MEKVSITKQQLQCSNYAEWTLFYAKLHVAWNLDTKSTKSAPRRGVIPFT